VISEDQLWPKQILIHAQAVETDGEFPDYPDRKWKEVIHKEIQDSSYRADFAPLTEWDFAVPNLSSFLNNRKHDKRYGCEIAPMHH
jgi:hypothetical protein